MAPSLKDMRQVLYEYEGKVLDDWASWLHENWHRERTDLRITIFGNLFYRLYRQ